MAIILLIALGALVLVAVIATLVQVARDGYQPGADAARAAAAPLVSHCAPISAPLCWFGQRGAAGRYRPARRRA